MVAAELRLPPLAMFSHYCSLILLLARAHYSGALFFYMDNLASSSLTKYSPEYNMGSGNIA